MSGPEAAFNLAAFYQAAARSAFDALEEARQRETAVLAETTRWQREAQTPQERAWANVYHAAITRVLKIAA